MKRFYQRDAWLFLKQYPGAWPRELCIHLGLRVYPGATNPYCQAMQILDLMRKRGIVRRAERGWEIVPGSKPPQDRRGHSAGSKAALAKHSRHNVAKMRARHGIHVKPVATTALEQAWGWLPSISHGIDAQNAFIDNCGSPRSPLENEAA